MQERDIDGFISTFDATTASPHARVRQVDFFFDFRHCCHLSTSLARKSKMEVDYLTLETPLPLLRLPRTQEHDGARLFHSECAAVVAHSYVVWAA